MENQDRPDKINMQDQQLKKINYRLELAQYWLNKAIGVEDAASKIYYSRVVRLCLPRKQRV